MAHCLCGNYATKEGMGSHQQMNRVAVPLGIIDPQGRKEKEVKMSDTAPTLRAQSHGNQPEVCLPVLTPDRAEKRQNGRRFKGDGEESFTLTAQDRHDVAIGLVNPENDGTCRTIKAQCYKNSGANFIRRDSLGASGVAVKVAEGKKPNEEHPGMYVELEDGCVVYAVWYEKYQCYIAIRKLTPKECFRLQGWSDDFFEKAAFVNSDSQLYKEAGNGVSVPVVEAIGRAMKGVH